MEDDVELETRRSAFEPEDDEPIYPTGTCFDDAPDFFMFLVNEDHRNSGLWIIVHGICLNPDDDSPFAHAWLESFGRVMDGGIYKGDKIMVEYPIQEFYSRLRVHDVTKYFPDEWVAKNIATNNYGPWEEKYKKLCKDWKNS